MNERFLMGHRAGREWRENASDGELNRVRMAAESLGKRGVGDFARNKGSASAYDAEFNLGFAVGALIGESSTVDA